MNTHRAIRSLRGTGIAAALASAGLVLAACGPTSTAAPAVTSSSTASTATGSASAAAVLHTSTVGLGTILVDSQGRTVYFYEHDNGTTSFCTGACATNWLPVKAASSVQPVSGVSAKLGQTKRSDGSMQLTVAGHPVYTFVGDQAPGETKGQLLNLNGGLWYVVAPNGEEIDSPATNSNSSTTSSNNGY